MKKIFLHVGYWKCGSTYIQTFCNRNKKNLTLNNTHYDALIKSRRFNGLLVPTLHEVGNFLLENDLESAKKLLNKIIIDSEEKNIILSGENMMNEKVVSLLNELFKEFLDRYIIKIIIYLRPLLDHSKSSYYQSIIYSDPIDDFHLDLSYIDFCKKYALKDYYKLPEIIKTYQYLFGNKNIKILPFNQQKFKKNNLGVDFLYNCELALDKLKKIKIPEGNINEKASINVLILNIYINKFLKLFNISWIEGRKFKNYLFNKFKLHLFFKENFDIFDSENYKDIYLLEKKFKKIEDKIEKDYGKKIFYGNKAIISKSKKTKLIFILLKNFTLMIVLKKIYIKSLFIIINKILKHPHLCWLIPSFLVVTLAKDAVSLEPLETFPRRVLNGFKYKRKEPLTYTRTIRNKLFFPLLKEYAERCDVENTIHLVGMMDTVCGCRVDKKEYHDIYSKLEPILLRLGRKLKEESESCSTDSKTKASWSYNVAFSTLNGHPAGSHMMVSALEGIGHLSKARIKPTFYFFNNLWNELKEDLNRYNADFVVLDEAVKSFKEALFYLKKDLHRKKIDTIIWYHRPWLIPLLFGFELAPNQIYLSQHFYPPISSKLAKGLMHFSGMSGKTERINGKNWLTIPQCINDLTDKRQINPELQKRFKTDKHFVIGSIAREDKLNNKAFLSIVVRLLKENNRAIFLYAGQREDSEVTAYFQSAGVGSQCHFIGWIDPTEYASIFDLYLDSFPMASGTTLLKAGAMGVPVVTMDSPYTIFGRDILPAIKNKDLPPQKLEKISRELEELNQIDITLAVSNEQTYYKQASRLINDKQARNAVSRAVRTCIKECHSDTFWMASIFVTAINKIVSRS